MRGRGGWVRQWERAVDGRQLLLVSVDTQGWKRGQRERVGVLAVVCCTYTLSNVQLSVVTRIDVRPATQLI